MNDFRKTAVGALYLFVGIAIIVIGVALAVNLIGPGFALIFDGPWQFFAGSVLILAGAAIAGLTFAFVLHFVSMIRKATR